MDAEFYCDCDAGWEVNHNTGSCTTRQCDGTTCLNGQACAADQLSCDCAAGYSGANCETVDHCYGRDCNGHGTCHTNNLIANDNCFTTCYDDIGADCVETCMPLTERNYTCECDARWRGVNCEIAVCTDNAACFNAGTCT